ncbi:MAG: hypothetical protein K2O01_05770 [Bacteroidales bacterium]|nr:hypothetical protein [Bacteroidales bacterium]
MKNLIAILLLAFLCQSCFTTRTGVGDYRIATKADKAASYTYSKAKQCYLFWGLIPLGHARTAVPHDGNCEIRTGFGFADFVVSLLTGGIFSMQTVKVKAPVQWGTPPSARPVPPKPPHHPHSPNAPVPPAPPRY